MSSAELSLAAAVPGLRRSEAEAAVATLLASGD